MKKTINKKVYDTETATFVGMVIEMHNCNNIHLYLYKKRNGEYFLEVCGFSNTEYSDYNFFTFESDEEEYRYACDEHNSFFGHGIVPLRECDVEHYLNKIK